MKILWHRLGNTSIRRAEVHWYEAHGVGRVEFKTQILVGLSGAQRQMFSIVRKIVFENRVSLQIPEGVDFLLLLESSEATGWAVCEMIDCPPGVDSLEEVSQTLAVLLDSARRYPPALAFAYEQLQKLPSPTSKAEVESLLCQILAGALSRQHTDNCFLAESLTDELGYRSQGGFYWIVAMIDGNQVRWVSDDYHIYEDPASEFKIDASIVNTASLNNGGSKNA